MGRKGPLDVVVQGAWRPSARRRPDYPLGSCSPAELTAVSPGARDVPEPRPADKSNQPKCHGQEGRVRCSEGTLDFCLNNGVHLSFEITIQGKAVSSTDPQRACALAEPDLSSVEPLIFDLPAPAPEPPPKAPDQRPHAEPEDHDENPM